MGVKVEVRAGVAVASQAVSLMNVTSVAGCPSGAARVTSPRYKKHPVTDAQTAPMTVTNVTQRRKRILSPRNIKSPYQV